MVRSPCCDKNKVKKGPWSPGEDSILRSYIHLYSIPDNWISLPHKIGLNRCGKSCRLRWLNYLRPNIKHGGFSEEEDRIIYSLYANIGSRWSVIATNLPGRTDNDIKNYWNTKLKKKVQVEQQQQQRKCLQIQKEIITNNRAKNNANFEYLCMNGGAFQGNIGSGIGRFDAGVTYNDEQLLDELLWNTTV